MRDTDGNQLDGLRELMEKLRRERQERLERSDLGGVYDEIARELDDIVDEERHAIDNALRDAETSGDERRADAARETAAERNMHLDLMPNDLAGKVRELSSYNWESAEAQRRFEADDGQAPRPAHAADGRSDVGGHAEHDPRRHERA